MFINNNFNSIGSNWWNTNNTGFGNNNLMAGLMPSMPGINSSNTPANFRNSFMNVRNSAESLRTSLHNMMGVGRNANSPFNVSRPVSNTPDAMRITGFDSNRLRNTNMNDFTVEVTQVAQAQRNEGTALTANSSAVSAGFSTGNNQMSINIGNQQFDINFNVSSTDTVRDVQQRIAGAINSRNIGVSARVDFSSSAGTSALVLESRETGVNNSGQPNFTVSGSSVATLGVNNVTQEAENARFRVNRDFIGAWQTSRTNDVSLGFGIDAELRETGTVEVNMERDSTAQINSFRDMVNNINSMLQSVQDNARGSRLDQQLAGLLSSNASSLNRVGISMNRDGFLTINEDRMRAAAESGELERFAGDGGARGNFGFVNRLERTVDNAIRTPASLTNNTQNNQNHRHLHRMNQLMHTGMLFNSWF